MPELNRDSGKSASWVYWTSTGAIFVAFMGSGFANVLRADHVMVDMVRLGYPAYFSTLLGAFKIAGALTVALPGLPRLKEWAYAGMAFDLTGAALSRAAIEDHAATIAAPLLVLLVVLVSWRTRPASRVSRAFSWTRHTVAGPAGGL